MTFSSAHLPPYLEERVRLYQQGIERAGNFVLYWMRSAVRSDENPALDTAIHLASEHSIPLLVYHAISQTYDYASDRHHTFMLEGARDVQQQFQSRGISYAFHLETPRDTGRHLLTLANEATIVVTEDMPVDPPRRFLASLARKTQTPIVCVDTACVVPMRLLNKPFTRAFEFRNATKLLYDDRIGRAWPKVACHPQPFDLSDLPFAPVDLQASSIEDLVAQCDIDHLVPAIAGTQGGSTQGYARWDLFKSRKLASYAQHRNNALIDGTSRMSPYLHYGMVSPMRIARETALLDHEGAEKFLDELLIWRELAYSFCFHRDDHDQWSALPNWAQETLLTHQSDRRETIYSWEQLARGKTQDRFWNAAQHSLLIQGELHNNVRMTWGKAVLNWTEQPEDALQMMIDLNHRYALDGRDPASYGGLLWCLGQFDRPFKPATQIFGSVRPRETAEHARRLNVEKYSQLVTKTYSDPMPRVAIIGAGISGLIAAQTLNDHRYNVKVFDKGRGVGGRMATRRIEGRSCFDHGAQYFTARDPRFRRRVNSWVEQGLVSRWPDPLTDPGQRIVVLNNGTSVDRIDRKESDSDSSINERFVGIPTMTSICKHLAIGIDVESGTAIRRIEQRGRGVGRTLQLIDSEDVVLGDFDFAIVATPAFQAAELLLDFPRLADALSQVKMQPCWATMVSLDQPVSDHWVGAFIHDSILTWVARNSTKPGRDCSKEHLVLHACPTWTEANWDRDPTEVARLMLDAFWQASGCKKQPATHLQSHRWKFAIPSSPTVDRCLFDAEGGVTACGDWAGGPRVEGAFLSGMAAAGVVAGKAIRRFG